MSGIDSLVQLGALPPRVGETSPVGRTNADSSTGPFALTLLSLAGLAAGLFLGLSPSWVAVFCIAALFYAMAVLSFHQPSLDAGLTQVNLLCLACPVISSLAGCLWAFQRFLLPHLAFLGVVVGLIGLHDVDRRPGPGAPLAYAGILLGITFLIVNLLLPRG